MSRNVILALLFACTSVAGAQALPGSQWTQPQQPGPQPAAQPGGDPIAFAAAPPVFAPGVGASNVAASPRPGPVRISGGVIARNVISKVDPVYPADARANHVQGTVVLSARVGSDGHVRDLAVVSGPAVLQTAALDAVRQWIYRPYVLNGEPVDVSTVIAVNFRLR